MIDTESSLISLEKYLKKEGFRGYDPYDTLNSWIPFKLMGKWGPILAIQFQKLNPVNIRPLLGIRKDINPKAFGLFLLACSLQFKRTGRQEYLEKASYIFNWLSENHSKGRKGIGWGYNFPWASTEKYLDRFEPSAVVTGFVCRGIYEYFRITQDSKARDLLISAAEFVRENLPFHEDQYGICISYTPLKQDYCYNASLLAAEVLARAGVLAGKDEYCRYAIKAVDWTLHYQKESGKWNYSLDIKTGHEREQVDFHQGYILESIFEIRNILNYNDPAWERSIRKGMRFYRENQFYDYGRSLWRIPKVWPVDIHNQSQGIITFSKLNGYGEEYLKFASEIATWTSANMQSRGGHFYYRKFKHYTNKIPYMRWGQAWMYLALCTLLANQSYERKKN